MSRELTKISGRYVNSEAIGADALNLPSILNHTDIVRPVFLILENTLGTIEGDYKKLLDIVCDQARIRGGELVLSLFRQQALSPWGISMYKTMVDMIGEPDLKQTNIEGGLYVSKTGYLSKWWSDDDVRVLKNLGFVVAESHAEEYYLIRMGFK